MKNTILVTGGAGYIGSIAVEMLLNSGFHVVVIDDLSTGHKDSLFSEAKFYYGQIGDKLALDKIFTENKIDAVMHFAGAALVEESMRNPYKYFYINFSQGNVLVDTMLKYNVSKMVFSSTCAIYGMPSEVPIKESTYKMPVNIYGESKLIFEKSLEWFKKSKNLDFVALRYFNVAGASPQRGEHHNPETHLIPLIIKSIKEKKNNLKVFGNDYDTKDGTAVRDYIHVVDLIDAHILAIKFLIQGKSINNFYNIGYGTGYSVLEIINAASEVFNLEIPYCISPRRPGDPPMLIADSSKIRNELNWLPKHNNIHEIIRSAAVFI